MAGRTANKRVLCVGLLCLDYITVCESFPKEDTDQRCRAITWQRGGNASNSCTCLALVGETPEYMGVIANTTEHQLLKSDMDRYGIKFEHVVTSSGSGTPTATILSNALNGSRTIMFCQSDLPEVSLDDFKQLPLHEHLYKWVHFEGRPTADVIKQMLGLIDEYNVSNPGNRIVTSVELEKPRINLTHLLDAADVVFMSKDYAQHLGYPSMVEAVDRLYPRCRSGATLICPWGELGAAANCPEGLVTSPCYPPEALVDTLAAGDTFNGATIAALSNGRSVREAISFGCRVAGAKCGMRGWKDMPPAVLRIMTH